MRTVDFNRPPEPIEAFLEPSTPTPQDAVVCRVVTDLLLDDLDYDVVQYEYVWTLNGEVVRRVTSAGHSDVLPRLGAEPCDVVACEVTPGDGKARGQSVSVRAVVTTAENPCHHRFLRGDCNEDGSIDISDASFSLSFQFAGGVKPRCGAACNSNGDAEVDVSDPIYLLDYLFNGRSAPPAPFPQCDAAAPVDCAEDTCNG